jgi:hypothetical protein
MVGARRGVLAAAGVAAASLAIGCAGRGDARDALCMPALGMDTAALALCGCRRYDGGGLSSMPESRTAGGDAAETVIIVNYICPLGDAGIGWATVINGVVDRLDY